MAFCKAQWNFQRDTQFVNSSGVIDRRGDIMPRNNAASMLVIAG